MTDTLEQLQRAEARAGQCERFYGADSYLTKQAERIALALLKQAEREKNEAEIRSFAQTPKGRKLVKQAKGWGF